MPRKRYSTVYINRIGGLGNQLFQFATAYAADPNGYAVSTMTNMGLGARAIARESFNETVFAKVHREDPPTWVPRYNEPAFAYTPVPSSRPVCLNGYFQSAKYFHEHRADILDIIWGDRDRAVIPGTTAVHVRRGDYLDLQDIHPVLPMSYYEKAYIPGTRHLVYSDDPDWCREHFPSDRYEVMARSDTVDDLFEMARCKNIITANSSYSWWAVYLGNHGRVVMPRTWFGPAYTDGDWKDVYYGFDNLTCL
jgi:hypothetical protein